MRLPARIGFNNYNAGRRLFGLSVLFKGDDWQGTEKGVHLERQFAEVGVEVAYLSYTQETSSSRLRLTLQNIDELAKSVTGKPMARLVA